MVLYHFKYLELVFVSTNFEKTILLTLTSQIFIVFFCTIKFFFCSFCLVKSQHFYSIKKNCVIIFSNIFLRIYYSSSDFDLYLEMT